MRLIYGVPRGVLSVERPEALTAAVEADDLAPPPAWPLNAAIKQVGPSWLENRQPRGGTSTYSGRTQTREGSHDHPPGRPPFASVRW
jgi:hypothetical protein